MTTRPAPLEAPPACTTCDAAMAPHGVYWQCRKHEAVLVARRAFVIPAARVDELRARFAKMARRAAKLGVAAPTS